MHSPLGGPRCPEPRTTSPSRSRRSPWPAALAALLAIFLTPTLPSSAQTGGTAPQPPEWLSWPQEEFEALYGHPLTAANIEEIRSWQPHDMDWWLDYERNQEACEKQLMVSSYSGNAVRTLVDPREHELLFGFHHQVNEETLALPPTEYSATLTHRQVLRPDLVVLTDEISQYAVDIIEPFMPDWNRKVGWQDIDALAWELKRNPEVVERIEHLAYLSEVFKLSEAQISRETRLFIFHTIWHLMPELRKHPSERLAQAEDDARSLIDVFASYEGDDPRRAYSDYYQGNYRVKFDATYTQASNFLNGVSDVQKQALLLYLINDRLAPTTQTRFINSAEWKQEMLSTMDESVRGRPSDFSSTSRENLDTTNSNLLQISLDYAENLRLRKDKEIQWRNTGGTPEEAEAQAAGVLLYEGSPTDPELILESDLGLLLYFVSAKLSLTPKLYGPDDLTREYGRGFKTVTCQHTKLPKLEGAKLRSWKRNKCKIEPDFFEKFAIWQAGKYQAHPDIEILVQPNLEMAGKLPSFEGNLSLEALGTGGGLKVGIDGLTFKVKDETMRHHKTSLGQRSNIVKFAPCTTSQQQEGQEQGQQESGAQDNRCSEDGCPEGMVLAPEGGCTCPAGSQIFEDEHGQTQCVDPCIANPALCERPSGSPIRIMPDKPALYPDDLEWDPWGNDENSPEPVVVCSETVIILSCVPTTFPGGVLEICEGLVTCAEPGSPKTRDCSKAYNWLYCDSDVEFVTEMPTAALCTPGEQRCVDTNLSQTCRSDGYWGTLEECSLGCDTGTGMCQTTVGAQCSGGEQRCVDDATLQFCEDGQWGSTEVCTNGCDSASQACLPTSSCQLGETRCYLSDSSVQYCSQGEWGSVSSCVYGCDPNTSACRNTPEDCSGSYPGLCTDPGARICDGYGYALACDYNTDGCLSWQVDDVCTEGCENGACTGANCWGSDLCSIENVGRCVESDAVEVCLADAEGCLRWTTPPTGGQCATGQVCQNGSCATATCTTHQECWESTRSCQSGVCAPCQTDADCGGGPWACSQTTQKCYAAF